MEVYFAPRTKHTAYVFLEPLFQQRGSDASWENDQEPPEHCVDYSDDEEERKAKAALKNKKRKGPDSSLDQNTSNTKQFQPRTQQNSRGRGRQRGGHHNQRRNPPNPFYMSLSNSYASNDQQTVSASVSNSEQSCEAVATANDVSTVNSQEEHSTSSISNSKDQQQHADANQMTAREIKKEITESLRMNSVETDTSHSASVE